MVNFSRPGMPSPNFFLWLALRWSNTVGLLFTIDFSANEVSVSFRVLAGKSLAAGGWKLSFSEIWRTLKGLGEEIGDLSSVMGDCMHGLADLAEDGGGEPMPRTSSALPLPLVVRTLVTEGLLGGAGLPKLASHPESFLKRPLCWSDSLRLGRNLANLSFKKNIYISLNLKGKCLKTAIYLASLGFSLLDSSWAGTVFTVEAAAASEFSSCFVVVMVVGCSGSLFACRLLPAKEAKWAAEAFIRARRNVDIFNVSFEKKNWRKY